MTCLFYDMTKLESNGGSGSLAEGGMDRYIESDEFVGIDPHTSQLIYLAQRLDLDDYLSIRKSILRRYFLFNINKLIIII